MAGNSSVKFSTPHYSSGLMFPNSKIKRSLGTPEEKISGGVGYWLTRKEELEHLFGATKGYWPKDWCLFPAGEGYLIEPFILEINSFAVRLFPMAVQTSNLAQAIIGADLLYNKPTSKKYDCEPMVIHEEAKGIDWDTAVTYYNYIKEPLEKATLLLAKSIWRHSPETPDCAVYTIGCNDSSLQSIFPRRKGFDEDTLNIDDFFGPQTGLGYDEFSDALEICSFPLSFQSPVIYDEPVRSLHLWETSPLKKTIQAAGVAYVGKTPDQRSVLGANLNVLGSLENIHYQEFGR